MLVVQTPKGTDDFSENNLFPYVGNHGDLTVIREVTNGQNKTIKAYAAGEWKTVEVV